MKTIILATLLLCGSVRADLTHDVKIFNHTCEFPSICETISAEGLNRHSHQWEAIRGGDISGLQPDLFLWVSSGTYSAFKIKSHTLGTNDSKEYHDYPHGDCFSKMDSEGIFEKPFLRCA